MKIGLIGAGKAGVSFGKYLTEHQREVTGFFDRIPEASKKAADFTHTKAYDTLDQIAADSDFLLITVPDGVIASVWEELKTLDIRNKIISHFSGAHSSALFSGVEGLGAFGYSIHPLFAFHDPYESCKGLSDAYFTIEGDPRKLDQVRGLLEGMGNPVTVIPAADKVKYHAAAAVVSNLYVGLASMGVDLLCECGYRKEDAIHALAPLIVNNAANIVSVGPEAALTGPVERNDTETVRAHQEALDAQKGTVYRLLSRQVLGLARRKNPDRDYGEMEELLK